MKVRLKLFATYRRYLPPDSSGNALDLTVPPGARVGDLLAQVGVPERESLVILVNGRDAGPERVLQEGDAVAVFPALAGG